MPTAPLRTQATVFTRDASGRINARTIPIVVADAQAALITPDPLAELERQSERVAAAWRAQTGTLREGREFIMGRVFARMFEGGGLEFVGDLGTTVEQKLYEATIGEAQAAASGDPVAIVGFVLPGVGKVLLVRGNVRLGSGLIGAGWTAFAVGQLRGHDQGDAQQAGGSPGADQASETLIAIRGPGLDPNARLPPMWFRDP